MINLVLYSNSNFSLSLGLLSHLFPIFLNFKFQSQTVHKSDIRLTFWNINCPVIVHRITGITYLKQRSCAFEFKKKSSIQPMCNLFMQRIIRA